MNTTKAPKRVLLKLSGEILANQDKFGIEPTACQKVALALQKLQDSGLEIAVVIGGGNIFRGLDLKALGMPRTPADHMGMLATMLNGIALQQALIALGCRAVVMSALECPKAVEPYNWSRACQYLQAKTVLIFVGGTGNPYFTTDTAAALRASEIEAGILLKATKVDGIYDKDPVRYSDAVKYHKISYNQVLADKLAIMDATAIALCRSNAIPILVFNMQLLFEDFACADILSCQDLGTLVQEHV